MPTRILSHRSNQTLSRRIYIPIVNWTLAILCLGVVAGFRTSDRLGDAYGISVITDMLLTSIFMR